ncbi:MAG TPA: cyclic nucleotide-binding domain-containing protein [Solirubrobacteraceae bacterium]|nr:cyclic nucleotide-binding domain-containing protein [Solirubrobacteraceae bacterium]
MATALPFEIGEPLIREGDARIGFMVLADGAAVVTRRGRFVRRLLPGLHAPELTLVDGQPATATVIAATPVQALTLQGRDFHALLDTVPSLARELVLGFASALRREVSSSP